MNLNFWPKMYYSGGGGGGGGSGGGGGGASGGGGAGGGGATGGAGYSGGAGAGGGAVGGGAAGEQSPEEPTPVGAFRFNTDSAKLEYWDGNQWINVTTDSPVQHTGGTRGLFGGGRVPGGDSNQIQFINVDSTGNGTDFGNLSGARRGIGGCSDRTRGLFGGGNPVTNTIDFVTIASTGDTTDFGDLSVTRDYLAGGNSSTRGIFAGGLSPNNHDTIDYVTIASTGNAVDFGNISLARQLDDTCESPTRCVLIAGIKGGPYVAYNTNEYITTSTTGNTADFGDLTNGVRYGYGSLSNAIRGVIGGGDVYPSPGRTNSIEFITIATLGNSIDFGDQTDTFHYGTATGSPTRGVFAGGNSPSKINSMCYINIMTTGDAVDFGDLNQQIDTMTGCSNGNGGLG